MVAAPGMPPEWNDVQTRAQQVEKLNPAGIQAVVDQFTQASKDSADHSTALRNATAALGGGTWSGPAADAFFAYVKQIGDAGRRVNDHLDEVAREMSNLQTSLADVKGRIDGIEQQARTDIEAANRDAVTRANAAEAKEREVAEGKEGATMPSPTSAEIMAANAQKTSGIATGARDQIQGLLNGANDQISRVMDLVKKDVQGGYASVPPLNRTPKAMQSTGGLRGGGGGSGGGGGGGGGMGPSGGPPSTPPPGNVRQWIEEAIRILQAQGVPVTEADIDKIWTIVEKESGGDPNAINLWDSNAKAGHPSKGLMQCIDSTFNAYKLPGHDDIYNPVDNIIAGVRYTFSRYGGFEGHPGLKSMAHGGAYQGY
ncbi:transglycosylase SLT domain-containing protein [Amycolatopsis thermophila]|uniref:WXG100 family type VII secretion target n=1 Tax=Amycolatopsis thermophila TaxID=206084 RepID=A0ABU0ESZ5_9PSEU|nr:transglycosylase SLT domain-containing protein [Amycolatopsis thermophila]MDQ0378422.1 WXG100 family type VII secretion target [Amycolatopsis thermophila]